MQAAAFGAASIQGMLEVNHADWYVCTLRLCDGSVSARMPADPLFGWAPSSRGSELALLKCLRVCCCERSVDGEGNCSCSCSSSIRPCPPPHEADRQPPSYSFVNCLSPPAPAAMTSACKVLLAALACAAVVGGACSWCWCGAGRAPSAGLLSGGCRCFALAAGLRAAGLWLTPQCQRLGPANSRKSPHRPPPTLHPAMQ